MNQIRRRLLSWYGRKGRAHLPWRRTRNPYAVLVSEFMLQQTQVERVLPKYRAFLKRFPSFKALAAASASDVIREWRGLGYNSRALRLVHLARIVVTEYRGRLPSERDRLLALPGVGAYTAAAVRAFAFECDDAPVDTNIRRVLGRLYGARENPLSLVPTGRAHDWNSALMDLGSTICTARAPKCAICPLRKWCAAAPIDAAALERERRRHAKKPSPRFERTTRYARGRIIERLRDLPAGKRTSLRDLERDLAELRRSHPDLREIVKALAREGLVEVRKQQVALAQ